MSANIYPAVVTLHCDPAGVRAAICAGLSVVLQTGRPRGIAGEQGRHAGVGRREGAGVA